MISTTMGRVDDGQRLIVRGLAETEGHVEETVEPRVEPPGLREQPPILGDDLAVSGEAEPLAAEQGLCDIETAIVRARGREIHVSTRQQTFCGSKGTGSLVEEALDLAQAAAGTASCRTWLKKAVAASSKAW